MALKKLKKLIEDLENNTSLEIGTLSKVATTSGYAGTSYKATSAGGAGTASVSAYATSAGTAGGAASIHGGAGTHTY